MSIESDMRERHGRVLAELAETGIVMVRRLSEALLAADDVPTQAQLGLAYHRVSRAVRQTLALEMRLWREARAPSTPARPRPSVEGAERPERVDWNEYESDDRDEALDELDVLLDADDLDEDAIHDAVQACIGHIRRDLDVAPLLAEAGAPAPPTPLHSDHLPAAPPPGGRRSRLMGGATALGPPLAAPPRAPPFPWPSSA